jgi:hypothetical protein
MTKLTSTNTSRADTEQCARCGRRKRADKLEATRIGRCCRRCAEVIADVYGEDTTL